MNIVITSGGTSEPIDTVRKITNNGNGTLGNLIAETLLKNIENVNIDYICSRKALKPQSSNVNITVVETVNDLKNAVQTILLNKHIDWFIHTMAVSDYTVDAVSTPTNIENACNGKTNLSEFLLNFSTPKQLSKISSNEKCLYVKLVPTPKVIGLIKQISPKTNLIGFKLLSNASDEQLINAATTLLKNNDCLYVIANNINEITATSHKAILIDRNGKTVKLETKQEIANAILKVIING